MERRAFTDESSRAAGEYLGVLLIDRVHLQDCRAALRRLALPGQRRIHMSDESSSRRRLVLGVLEDQPLEGIVYRLRRDTGIGRIEARGILLRQAAQAVLDADVRLWVLDRQETRQEVRDRRAIAASFNQTPAGQRPAYRHLSSTAEPLLWAVDALTWAAGAGRDWLRRAEKVIRVVRVAP